MRPLEQFDPLRWQAEKDQDSLTPVECRIPYSPEGQIDEYEKMAESVMKAIDQAHLDYGKKGLTYPLVGIAITGSFLHQTVRPISDLDVVELQINDNFHNGVLYYDFTSRLHAIGFTRELDGFGKINIRDGRSFGRPTPYLRDGYKIVTPFPALEQQARETIDYLIDMERRGIYVR